MANGNGNSTWTRWVIGLLVSIAIFFGGFFSAGIEGSGVDARLKHLEEEASKGERWTRRDAMVYQSAHAAEHSELVKMLAEQNVKIQMICKATSAGC